MPLKILEYHSNFGGLGQQVIQEMDSGNKDYFEHILLTSFAGVDSGIGTLSVNPADSSDLTHIGTFTDTKRNNPPGTHPVSGTDITTVTYKFYQDLRADSDRYGMSGKTIENGGSEAAHTEKRPLAITNVGNDSSRTLDGGDIILKEMSDSAMRNDIIGDTQNNLVRAGDTLGSGLGAYKLQASAPTDGTWTAKATITNSLQNTSNDIKLWRKTALDAAKVPDSLINPLYWDSDHIGEMDSADMLEWLPMFRNKIVSNGIGQYKLQQNAPGGGTWVAAGDDVIDTRYETANQNYASGFTGYFSGTFTNTFVNFFTGNYQRFFNGSSGGFFSGTRPRYFTGSFTGTYAGTFTGYFTGLTVQGSTEDVSTVKLWIRQA